MTAKHEKINEKIFLAILFCFAIALFNLSGYIFSALVLCMFIFHSPGIRLYSTDIWLILFSVSYMLFFWLNFEVDITVFIQYCVGPWCAHILGRLYVERSANNKAFIILISVISAGMYLHGVLNIIAYMRSDYFSYYQYYRQSVDFWRRELVNVKSTEMLYTFATGACMGVLFSTYKLRYKVLSAIVVILSVALSVFMANRALLVILAVLFFWRYICWLLNTNVSFRKKFATILGSLLLLLFVVIMVALNVAGAGDFFYSLKIVQRFMSNSELTRVDVWVYFLEDMFFLEHPFGGKLLTQNSEWGYLHNMWLDIYNIAGIIPFLLSLIFSVKFFVSFLDFNQLMKKRKKENERLIFQSLMLATLLNMMIEPILEANPYYFLMTLMFLGAMDGYIRRSKNEKDSITEQD